MSVKNYFSEMPEHAGLFRKIPVNASGMDFTHKCRHFPKPGSRITWIFMYIIISALKDTDFVAYFVPISTIMPLTCTFTKFRVS